MGLLKETLTDERLEYYGKLYEVYKESGIIVPEFWLFVEQRTKYIECNRGFQLKKALNKLMEEGYYDKD